MHSSPIRARIPPCAKVATHNVPQARLHKPLHCPRVVSPKLTPVRTIPSNVLSHVHCVLNCSAYTPLKPCPSFCDFINHNLQAGMRLTYLGKLLHTTVYATGQVAVALIVADVLY